MKKTQLYIQRRKYDTREMELCVCDGGSTSVKLFCNRVVSQERKT